MNVGSLFSGIGGLDYGLRRAGFIHAFFCEGGGDPNGTREERQQWATGKYRRSVLTARWPGVPVYEDVRLVGKPAGGAAADGRGPPVDLGGWQAGTGLLCGGFPCQDLSVAGQRRGLAGNRSGLFFEYARIAESLRPQWLLVENVPGLLSSNGGRDFGIVLGTLADLGYGLAWRILDSRFFGVPQRRRRVFIIGALANGDPRAAAGRAGEVLAVGSRCDWHPPAGVQAGQDSARTLTGGSGGDRYDKQPLHYYVEDHEDGPLRANGAHGGPPRTDKQPLLVAAPLSHGSNPNSNMARRRREDDANLVTAFSHTQGLDAQPSEDAWPTLRVEGGGQAVGIGAGVRRLTPTECERLQALPDGWTQLGGTPDSRRYAALGDAVTSSVAEWIGHRLLAASPPVQEQA